MRHDEWEEEYGEEEHHHVDTSGPFRTQCAFCKGTGVNPATMKMLDHQSCPVCKGVGVHEFKGNRSSYNQCSKCGGSGKDPKSEAIKPCSVCSGQGIV
jgi:DnaJ-class molecular chaperone